MAAAITERLLDMRILHMIPDIGITNGVMSVILNYFKAMPQDIKFDVVYFTDTEKTRQSDIEALGGRVFKIAPPSPKDLLTGKMNGFFANHKGEWEAVHIHCPHFAIFLAPYARKSGIKKVAVHCHSTWYSLNPKNNKRNKLLFEMGRGSADVLFACGRDAGRFWYGRDENFVVLPNAVNCEKFRFNPALREQKRRQLGLQGKFVVGHLGRVSPPQKNHKFLMEVFAQIKKKNPNSVLLMAGAQENEELAALAEKLNIKNDIQFLGARTDVDELCQAYDVFVFPSFWEGLPVSVVEAQAAGLPVVMSDCITDEVCVSDRVAMLSLQSDPALWADTAIALSHHARRDNFELMKKHGWDICSTADRLVKYYTTGEING